MKYLNNRGRKLTLQNKAEVSRYQWRGCSGTNDEPSAISMVKTIATESPNATARKKNPIHKQNIEVKLAKITFKYVKKWA